MTIGIIDIGIGNLGSLRQAIYGQGWDPVLVSNPCDFADISHLMCRVSGVFGSNGQLAKADLIDPILEFSSSGHPILGICLGMQLLASAGTEGGRNSGLGLVPGEG